MAVNNEGEHFMILTTSACDNNDWTVTAALSSIFIERLFNFVTTSLIKFLKSDLWGWCLSESYLSFSSFITLSVKIKDTTLQSGRGLMTQFSPSQAECYPPIQEEMCWPWRSTHFLWGSLQVTSELLFRVDLVQYVRTPGVLLVAHHNHLWDELSSQTSLQTKNDTFIKSCTCVG